MGATIILKVVFCFPRACAGGGTSFINSAVESTRVSLLHIIPRVGSYHRKLSNLIVFPTWHLGLCFLRVWLLFFILRYDEILAFFLTFSFASVAYLKQHVHSAVVNPLENLLLFSCVVSLGHSLEEKLQRMSAANDTDICALTCSLGGWCQEVSMRLWKQLHKVHTINIL